MQKYSTSIDYGYAEDGHRLRKRIRANSKAELKRKEAEFRASLAEGLITSDMPFQKYAEAWLRTTKDIRSGSTKAMYENIVKTHLTALYRHPVSDIKPTMLQEIINEKKDHPRTCQQIKCTLRQIFKSAIADDIVRKNPADNISVPTYKPKEKRTLTPYEKSHILTVKASLNDKAYLYIAYGCGLRREEILALTRSDIDMRSKTISVNKAIAIVKNVPILKDTKSASGVRTVPMPPFLYEFMKEFLPTKDIVLFQTSNGRYYGSGAYTKMWQRITKALYADLTEKEKLTEPQDLTSHMLRHNYCTELCYAGLSIKETAKLLGHSDYKMVMDVYSHIDEKREKAAEKIEAINF